jgi:hypothetical protein
MLHALCRPAAVGSPAAALFLLTGSAVIRTSDPVPQLEEPQPSTSAGMHAGTFPDDVLPLQLRMGAVLTNSVGVVLDALPSSAFATGDAACTDHGAMVLGFQSAEGPTSFLDLSIGQVSSSHPPHTLTDHVHTMKGCTPRSLHPPSPAHAYPHPLSTPQLNASRLLACARCKLWWMTPEWRTSTLDLPPETQFLLAELKGGEAGQAPLSYALLLPLIDGDFRTTLRAGR